MIIIFHKMVYIIWGILFLFWFISAIWNRSTTERRESIFSRLLYLGLLGIAIGLIAFDPFIYGPLLQRIIPDTAIVSFLGIVILILGLSFAIWARLHLGRYWSARIALEKDHQLIQTGPYRIVRNPIYFGGLVGVIGTAIVIGELRGVLAIFFVLIAFLRKINMEEMLLNEQFGAIYVEYKKKVKSLIPLFY